MARSKLHKTGKGGGRAAAARAEIESALTDARRRAAAAAAVASLAKRVPSSATLRRQYVLCGKPRCRKWHGPYWYAFWHRGGAMKSAYIGSDARMAAFLSAQHADDDRRWRVEVEREPPYPPAAAPSGTRRRRPR